MDPHKYNLYLKKGTFVIFEAPIGIINFKPDLNSGKAGLINSGNLKVTFGITFYVPLGTTSW